MDEDRIKGSMKQVKGAVKEAAGKVTGDAKLQSEGKADKVAGKISEHRRRRERRPTGQIVIGSAAPRSRRFKSNFPIEGSPEMVTILVIVLLLILLGGGGGYYGYSRYGGRGLGGVLGLVLIVIIVIWLVGGIHV